MDTKPLKNGNRYTVQSNSSLIKGIVKEIEYKLDVNTLEKIAIDDVQLNDIVRVKIKTAIPFPF
jgi:sulfate adenylyltransferase subunit 1